MRVLNFIMCLFRRELRRRQEIVQLFARHPDREYMEYEVQGVVGADIEKVHADLLALQQSGHVYRRVDRNQRAHYRIRPGGGVTA